MIAQFFGHARHGRMLRFLFAGGTATVVDIVLVYICTDIFGIWYLASATIAFCSAVVVSFVLQKFWTFQNSNLDLVHAQFARFTLNALIGLLLNTLTMYTLVEYATLHYLIAKIVASGLVAFMNFFAYKFVVFPR